MLMEMKAKHGGKTSFLIRTEKRNEMEKFSVELCGSGDEEEGFNIVMSNLNLSLNTINLVS